MERIVNIDLENCNDGSWEVKLSGAEKKQIETQFQHIDEVERDKIFMTAAKILSNCPNPKSENERKTGLALGKVQSGKTASFIALNALAFDNGYRIVIVLAGTKKNLLRQNTERIKKQFGIETRRDRKIACFSTHDSINDIRESTILGVLENGNNVLITVLKHHSHIKHIKNILKSADINSYPTLIVDDEGDQASLNALVRKGKKTSTYSQITELRNVLKLHAYVAVTATPQANLLIKTIDDLSPGFCVLIEPGKGYTGGSTFHGKDKDKFIREIPESDIPFEDMQHIPSSFIKALSTFLLGACVRTLRGDEDIHSMLVHTSHEQIPHKTVSDKVNNLVESWKHKLLLPDGDPAKSTVLSCIEKSYSEICNPIDRYPDWDKICKQLCSEIKNLYVWIVNSSNYGQIPTSDNMHFKNNIFIGGNMLDRGVTLPGLAVTYLTRWAKEPQADTVEQRARWFGYKQSYLDLCRIYMPLDVSKGFLDLLGHEDDLWESLRIIEGEGLPIKSWPRILSLPLPFKPTRPSVATVNEFKYDGWTFQMKPEIDLRYAEHNVGIARAFFKAYKAKERFYGNVKHQIIEFCKSETVISDLLSNLKYSDTSDWDDIFIRELFARLIRTGTFIDMDVVLMRPDGEGEEREVNEKGKMKNLMQGHSVRIPETSPNYYAGDYNIHNNRVQLQVHIVKPHDKLKTGYIYPEKTIALALFVPESYTMEIGRLVKGLVKVNEATTTL